MNKQATLSNLLNQTFREMGENRQILITYLVIIVPVMAIAAYLEGPDTGSSVGFGFGFQLTDAILGQGVFAALIVVAAAVIDLVMTYWLYAALMRRASVPGFDRFWPWLGIYILAMLGIIFGLVLFIIPGIILAIRWMVVLPLVIEGKSSAMDTFGESWDLVRGNSWSVFGAVVVLFVGGLIISGIAGAMGVFLGGLPPVVALLSAAIDAILTAVFIAFAVGAYHLLKDDAADIAEIFD